MTTALVRDIAESHDLFLEPLTVEQYHAMMKAGILREGAPIELIDGLLVQKDRRDARNPTMTVGTLHSLAVTKLAHILSTLIAGHPFHVRSQQPATVSEVDEPEPDIAVVHGAFDDFRARHPGPADVALVIEVADSSLTYDRTTKQRLYAVAGIPQYWIVDLTTNQIEVYERPNPSREQYESAARFRAGDIATFTIGSHPLVLKVGDIL